MRRKGNPVSDPFRTEMQRLARLYRQRAQRSMGGGMQSATAAHKQGRYEAWAKAWAELERALRRTAPQEPYVFAHCTCAERKQCFCNCVDCKQCIGPDDEDDDD